MDNTLRKALWGFLRPLVQLLTNLLSLEKGEEWEREFKKFLRKEPCWEVKPAYELWLAPGQQDGGKVGHSIEGHLIRTDLDRRCYSLNDDLVKSWLADPTTYPEALKSKVVILWPSKQRWGQVVPSLVWRSIELRVEWRPLHGGFDEDDVTLLKTS